MKPILPFGHESLFGFKILCGPYTRSERTQLASVIADMERGKVDYALVGTDASINVMRRGMRTVREGALL